MTTVQVDPKKLYELCKEFFEREDQKRKQEVVEWRKQLYSKRRMFGLLPPKYTKEEVESWEVPGIYQSMEFQTMWPHHQLYSAMLAANVAMKCDVRIIDVDARLFAALK